MRLSASHFRSLKGILVLAAANSLLWSMVQAVVPGAEDTSTVVSWFLVAAVNLVRVCLVLYAGWVVVRWQGRGLWWAALAGALVMFIDHPVVHGALFLLMGEPVAFGGVLVSYVMFVWIEMGVGALGGVAARRYLSQHNG